MERIVLNDGWQMHKYGDTENYACNVPCSVYHTLMTHGVIEDPYYRDNADAALAVSDDDYCFTTTFGRPDPIPQGGKVMLCFDGIDTISEITLNGTVIGSTDNMHRRWRFDVTALLGEENTLSVHITSPTRYIAEKQAVSPLWGVNSTVAGFPHIRKAHYMFGWDWGPQLPDMGIWRDVYLESYAEGRIESVYYRQNHAENAVSLTAEICLEEPSCGLCTCVLSDPDGAEIARSEQICAENGRAFWTVSIENPKLWWARGYGEQPLYTMRIDSVSSDGCVLDSKTDRIGLRTITVRQEPDAWGESFCVNLNGRDIFCMGANLIPLDQLLPRCTAEKETQLLDACADANFNMVRIWGGGYYPSDHFYDDCDEKGLLVWQDFMFACAVYRLTDEFWKTTEAELRDNLLRLRNHPSLAMWCGNNEIETAIECWGETPRDEATRADYIEQFEKRMPALVAELDPQHFYWRSSPSAYGGIHETWSNHAGDMHYWEVWHSFKPFTAFRELYYRFCSEYGFESVPSLKTLLTVCDPEKGDLNLMSPVMEAHQKCDQGNEKLMYYLAQMMRYPESFESLIYSTQLMQAEYIRSSVAHMRRARGRCMGSLYWQVNDTNPVISWSSVDFYGRWKAMHHFAKRFHAPVLLSVDERDAAHPVINVSNETLEAVSGTIFWRLCDKYSQTVAEGSMPVKCDALQAVDCPALDLSAQIRSERDRGQYYIHCELHTDKGIVTADNTLFVVPKRFDFVHPEICMEMTETPEVISITLSADAYVKAVCLDCRTLDVDFSDNWFDLEGGRPVTVTIPKTDGLTAEKLREELIVTGT